MCYCFQSMKGNDFLAPQIWFVVLMFGVLVWLGWFLSQEVEKEGGMKKSTESSVENEVNEDSTPPPEYGKVTDIIDSITFVMDDEFVVRYVGVVTPSTLETVQCFGKEASRANESMMGKTVRLEEDPLLSRAADGAWVRYVWVPENEKSQEAYNKALSGAPVAGLGSSPAVVSEAGEDENEEKKGKDEDKKEEGDDEEDNDEEERIDEYLVSERIIEMGLGFPLLSKDMVYYDKLSAAARFSSATKRGLWGACDVTEGKNGLLETQEITDCVIKGVELLDGEKVYRMPSCKAYKDTVVLDYKGGEWLCDEEEAKNKGYAKAIDCL